MRRQKFEIRLVNKPNSDLQFSMKYNNPRRVPAPSVPRNDASQSDDEEEKDGGYLANLSPESVQALEEKKAQFAARILAKRKEEAEKRAAAEREAKKEELQYKKVYVRGNKLCAANRIYEDESGWYICEVCDKKFNDAIFAEDHINSEKHKRNLEWYKDRPLPSDESGINSAMEKMPEYVKWDPVSQFYICELCSAKAASLQVLEAHLEGQNHKKKVANQAYWEAHASTTTAASASAPAAHTPSLPVYCQYDKLAQTYVCRWCDKKSPCMDMLEVHLIGKEHAKKTSNIGMVPYGHPDHAHQAKAYTDKYGFDLWARREHWPPSMQDDPASGCWKCVPCNKKFLTPSAVNDHLLGHSPTFVDPLSAPAGRPTRHAPSLSHNLIVQEPHSGFECALCLLPFDSAAALADHERTDYTHKELLRMMRDQPLTPEAAIAAAWEPSTTIDL